VGDGVQLTVAGIAVPISIFSRGGVCGLTVIVGDIGRAGGTTMEADSDIPWTWFLIPYISIS
jgi:hypothetical protein